MKVTGSFEVKLQPLEPYTEGKDGIKIGRMSIDKTFSGELSALSTGEMLSAAAPAQGSAGYIALEQVTGHLSGKKGGFVLHHYGVMNRTGSSLLVEVIPDSGTGELEGISGKMSIRIENNKHFYDFDYELNKNEGK